MKNKTKAKTKTKKSSMDLRALFLDELADLTDAEDQLIKVLPKMAAAAKSPDLADAFTTHLEETRGQVIRLKQVFESIDETVKKQTCDAMKGLLKEGGKLMEELKGTPALDAGLIAAAQKVEHYEIASYGSVHAWAEKMGYTEAVNLLSQTLNEESAADKTLTDIALAFANDEADVNGVEEEGVN